MNALASEAGTATLIEPDLPDFKFDPLVVVRAPNTGVADQAGEKLAGRRHMVERFSCPRTSPAHSDNRWQLSIA
jgi:hypothetical protein